MNLMDTDLLNRTLCFEKHRRKDDVPNQQIHRWALVPLWVHSARTHPSYLIRKRGKFGPLRCDELWACSNWNREVEATRHTCLAVSGLKRSKFFFMKLKLAHFPHLNFASWRCRGGLSSLRWRAKVPELSSSSSAWRPRCHGEIEPAIVHHSPTVTFLICGGIANSIERRRVTDPGSFRFVLDFQWY